MKNNKGITLIALIITIIVMLILAGVSINMVIGENGVITKAESAKIEKEKAEKREEVQIAVLAAKAKLQGKNITEVEQLKNQLNSTKWNIEEINSLDPLDPTDVSFNEFLIFDKEKFAFYVTENGEVIDLKIIDSSENGKEFSWEEKPNYIDKLKYNNLEFDGVVQFPDYIKKENKLYPIYNLASHANAKFKEIILPMNIEKNDGNKFYNCVNLEKVTIGNCHNKGTNILPNNYFLHCSNLKQVVFKSNKINEINASAFSNTALETIKLSKNIHTINNFVFDDCINLKNVYIDMNIKEIRMNAFRNCTALEKIQINLTAEEIKNNDKLNSLLTYSYTTGRVYDKNGNLVTS